MDTPGDTPRDTPGDTPEVSPELLEPLVAVVATLGELGASPWDVPLAVPGKRLRGGLMALAIGVRRAMGGCSHDVTALRHALATLAGTSPGSPGWATVAAELTEWGTKVAAVGDAWAAVAADAERLRDATAAAAGATPKPSLCHLGDKVTQGQAALQEVLVASRSLPMTSEPEAVTSALEEHEARVAKATLGLREATAATEEAAVALVASMDARGWGQQAAAAVTPLGRLVAAAGGVVGFYRRLRCHLEAAEVTAAAAAAGGGPGVPEELVAAVAAAEGLWDASARLVRCHLLGTLRVAQELLGDRVPDVTKAEEVTRRLRDASAALPELLPPPQGQR